jgi:hypothetical protein
VRAHLAIGALALAACEVAYQPEVGPVRGSPVADGAPETGGDDGGFPAFGPCSDSDAETAVSLALDIRPLMYRSPGGCGCHASSSTSGFNLGTYDRLRQGGNNSGERIVVPGAPCDSILVQKLGPTPPFGSRMPFNGPPYFSPEELALVEDWIAEGALDN